jgi:hypothetical protein
MKYALLIILVAVSAYAGAMDIYVDCEAQNKLDLVFVIDSSGSMGSTIAGIRSFVSFLDTALSEVDVNWGAITFVDSTGDQYDFDTTTPGLDLTDDFDTFIYRVNFIGVGGRTEPMSDTPEEALDALWVAAHCINWRPRAKHIAFLFTDAVFCEIDDICANCHSNLTKEECLDTLMNHDIRLFSIIRYPLYYSSCVPAAPYHTDFWEMATVATGGDYFNLLDDWQSHLLLWMSYYNDSSQISIRLKNDLGVSANAVVRLENVSGMRFEDSLFDLGTLTAGGSDSFLVDFTTDDTATKPAFHVIGDFDGGAYVETLLVALDSCGCHEAVVELERGWNAVSLPSNTWVPISYFETAIGDAYLYNPVLGEYETAVEISSLLGYWILSNESDRVMFAGHPLDGVWMPTFRGWNLLGGGSLPFYATEGESLGAPIWPMFEYLDGEYEPSDIIEIGKGYWLLENAAGRWEAP